MRDICLPLMSSVEGRITYHRMHAVWWGLSVNGEENMLNDVCERRRSLKGYMCGAGLAA